MSIGMNPIEMFRLAPSGLGRAGNVLSTLGDGQTALTRAGDALPKGPGGGLQVSGAQQEIPIVEDALVLSDAMLQIFDGGKLVIGEARTTDKQLDRSEFGIANFEAVDLDKSGKLNQAEIYIMLLKAGPEKRLEMLQHLQASGEKAGKANNAIKWIARGVTAVDIASIAAVWILRFAFNIFSLPISAIVSTVPPILAQFFGVKGIEKQVEKLNGIRGEIAGKFDTTIAAAK
ncbi:MAG: hypothetical protein FJZ01_22210 [Candidatus Sericytochromatia bacterium]|nr:hypothetical protein [Candidatus Tanganyikabacteria bacterium]